MVVSRFSFSASILLNISKASKMANFFVAVFRCGSSDATLTVYNTEKPEDYVLFTAPMASAELKGCHPVQNLGASISYLRRYLYVNALEIVEHDALDATVGADEPKSAKPIAKSVFDTMPDDDQKMIQSFAVNVIALLAKDDVAGAVEYINSLELDADWKTALWSQLDSKQRSAIKKLTNQ